METESFSKRTKRFVSEQQFKKKCCARIFDDGMKLSSDRDRESAVTEAISALHEHVRCDGCTGAFVRALFIVYGSVTDPGKSYHLEFSLRHEADRDAVTELLASAGFTAGKAMRRGRYIAYFKGSETIEDMLAFIGASGSAFDMINKKIVKEFRNNTNRCVNCDTANIDKALDAAGRQIEIIRLLEERGIINKLPDQLRVTAKLRLEHDDASMSQLAALHDPPISKSGVKHRLDRITEYADE